MIETIKSVNPNTGSEFVKIILGLPIKEHVNKLISIIRDYEEHNLKDVLLKKVAEQLDDNVQDYKAVRSAESTTPLGKYMSDYEDVVNDEKVFYVKKNDIRYEGQ